MLKIRKNSVVLAVLISSLIALLQPVAVVYSQGEVTTVTALIFLEKKSSKETVAAIEAIEVEVLAGTAREGHPAVLGKLPPGKADAIMALPGVVSIQMQPSVPRMEASPSTAPASPYFARRPGHGADAVSEIEVTAKDRQYQSVVRSMAKEWVKIFQPGTLNDTELAKMDAVVRNQAYHAVFNDPRVKGKVEAEVKRLGQASALTVLSSDSKMALQSAADEQTISVIIELDAPPAAGRVAAIASWVKRVRYVFEIIDAISADLTPAQLAAVAQLPFVRHIWSNGPAREQVNQSAQQIGAYEIHNMGIDGSGVRVAVVDNGVWDNHVEYDGQVVVERFDVDDGDHATHVAGIIAANFDRYGVAPGAMLVDAVISPADSGLPLWDDVIAAIEWAASDTDGNADVINTSIGAELWRYPTDGSGPIDVVIDNVITRDGPDSYHAMVIVSAGNEARDHDTHSAEQHPDHPNTIYAYIHNVNVANTGDGLQITLWWDNSYNDLDLKLYAPDGTEMDASTGSPGSDIGSNPDIVYEQVSVSQAQVQSKGIGTWQARVIASDVPYGPQDYHLAIDNDTNTVAEFSTPNPEGTVPSPGTARYALTVGSLSKGPPHTLSDFSNQGPTNYDPPWGDRIKPEIMAPGEDINSSTITGGAYGSKSGTSQAAPHVAGTAALLLDAAGKRADGSWQLSYQEVRGTIIDTAEIIDGNPNIDNDTGAGLVKPTNAIFTGTITHHGNRYFKVTPKYTTDTYPGGKVLSFDWESVVAHWDTSSNDLDLHLYRLDTGAEVAYANTGNPGYEKLDGQGAAPDDYEYVLRVYGWSVSGTDTFYGVSTNDIQSVSPPALVVNASASNPGNAEVNQDFTIQFQVENNGDLPARNASATLNLPLGVTIVSGANPQNLGSISPGGQATATWTVRSTSEGTKSFSVDVSSTSWGATWTASGSDSVDVHQPAVVGPIAYQEHMMDDDHYDQSSGNNDGIVNCGESIELWLTLHNYGNDTATGVEVTLSESDPYVNLSDNYISAPDIPGGSDRQATDDFDFSVDSGTPDGHVINFGLDINASNGGPWSDSFEVTVVCNHSPDEPHTPLPDNLASGQELDVGLSWGGGDPDPGDTVTYDVYFEADNYAPTILICNDISQTSCDPGLLDYETDYYWYVVATDNHDASTVGDVWVFTTKAENQAPNAPGSPSPNDGASGVPATTNLTWSGGDPDAGDTVTYDVYFDADNPAPDMLICDDVASPTCDPGPVDYEEHYYWYVVATDNHGDSTTGNVWDFTTEAMPPTVGPLVYYSSVIDDDTSGQSNGNSDGMINCGENIELWVTLRNLGGGTATSVGVTLSESDAYVTVSDGYSSAPDIPGSSNGQTSDDFDFSVDSGTPDGHTIHFDLNIGAANGGPWTDSFDLPVTCNQAPNTASSPSPPDGASNQSITVDLNWIGGDPDPGDTVTYDVFFEASDPTPEVLICNDVSSPMCDPGALSYETNYYWYVVATDNHGLSTTAPVWDFTTTAEPNTPPHEPSNPSPLDMSMDQSVYTDISWQGGDPDPGDTVTYDVYFGEGPPPSTLPPPVSSGQSATTYDPGLLNIYTMHWWKIVARDNHGETTEGPTWGFRTEEAMPGVGPVEYYSHRITDLGDGDGTIECDEEFELYVTLHNDGDTTATDVYIEDVWPSYLSYVVPLWNEASVGDIIGAGLAESDADIPMRFGVMSSVPDGLVVHMDMDIDASNVFGSPDWSDTFDIVVDCEAIKIVINEVDPDTPDAAELYNASSQALDMTGWHLIAYEAGGAVSVDYTFPAGFTLQPGSYVVVHEFSGTDTDTDLYTGSNIVWIANAGAAALTDDNGVGVDFMRWGESSVTPPSGTAWTGVSPSAPSASQTLSRDEFSTDTDDGSDWSSKTPTLGGRNVECYALTLTHLGDGSDPTTSPTNSAGCSAGMYTAGEVITLTASPASHWHVMSWDGTDNNVSTSTTNTVTMPANNHTATVYYEQNCYDLKLAHTGAGTDPVATPGNSVGCPGDKYIIGESIALSATPDSGWRVAGWSGTADDGSISSSNSLTMPGDDHTATVNYELACYTLTRTHTGSGSDPVALPGNSPGCPADQYLAGGTISLTANPDGGWRVWNWSGTDDDGSTSTNNSLTMPATDHIVGVTYVEDVSGSIVINEIHTGDPDWIEFYNPGSEAIDMTGWHLIAYNFGSLDHTYIFLAFTLQPGAYVVLHEYSGTDTATDLYTSDNSFAWSTMGSNGAAVLTSGSGSGVDFVQWGGSTVEPPAGTSWTGSNPASPTSGQTLGRDENSTDTDDGSDWTAQNPTQGARNGSQEVYLPLILRNH